MECMIVTHSLLPTPYFILATCHFFASTHVSQNFSRTPYKPTAMAPPVSVETLRLSVYLTPIDLDIFRGLVKESPSCGGTLTRASYSSPIA